MPPSLLNQLISRLQVLPGVGPKSAQRIAYNLLEHNRAGGMQLAEIMELALTNIQRCSRCQNLTEEELCEYCSNPNRNDDTLCIVESPADLLQLEQSTGYNGRYFVLGGRLSPIEGIGPAQLGIDKLSHMLSTGQVKEVILATNPTVEGEATAHYISELSASYHVTTTRIAHGVPMGGELEFVDSSTIAQAFADRKEIG